MKTLLKIANVKKDLARGAIGAGLGAAGGEIYHRLKRKDSNEKGRGKRIGTGAALGFAGGIGGGKLKDHLSKSKTKSSKNNKPKLESNKSKSSKSNKPRLETDKTESSNKSPSLNKLKKQDPDAMRIQKKKKQKKKKQQDKEMIGNLRAGSSPMRDETGPSRSKNLDEKIKDLTSKTDGVNTKSQVPKRVRKQERRAVRDLAGKKRKGVDKNTLDRAQRWANA